MLNRSAIILAGGSSTRFKEDKAVLELDGRPLLNHAVDAVKGLVDEVLVVTCSKERSDAYANMVSSNVKFAVDVRKSEGPLVGALTGFEVAKGEYSLLLPVDSPFVSKEVVSLLFELCVGKAAVVPRWTSMECEPLHSVYHTMQALKAAEEALAEGELDLQSMLSRLRGVRYVSMLVLEQLDPDKRTFFNINTPLDLKKAVAMSKPKPNKRK